jgi:hypothetical protein
VNADCKIVEAHLGQGEKGHAVEVTLTDPITKVSLKRNVAYFPEDCRDVAVVLAKALDKEWETTDA